MRPTDKIQNLIKNLNDQTRPELDEKILQNCYTELNTQESSAPEKGPNIWSTIMHSKITKPIAAAIIIIGALLSLTMFNKTVSSAYAIEETLKAMQQIETIHLFGKDWDENEFEMWIKLNPDTGIPDYVYHDYFTQNALVVSRPDKSYQYNSNRVLINSGKLYNIDTAPAKIFEQALKASKNPLIQADIDISHEYAPETNNMVIVINFETANEARKIYIDPKTKLPIRIVGLKNGQLGSIFKDIDYIEYNVELPQGIFEFEVTEGMKVVDMDLRMKQINDPKNGISAKGLTEQEAVELLITDYWNAMIAGDEETARKLSPAYPKILDGSQLTELVKIGKPYIQNGCGIGKVVPCRLRYIDGTLKEVRLIMRYRKHNDHESYTIAGTWGGVRTIKE